MRLTTTLLLVATCALPGIGAAAETGDERPLIQIALLLDTSNSMDGLIDQARTQLWKVVNELATARRGDGRPRLEVALYEYGNDSLPAGEGHLRLVVPLTTDLDRISEQLWALDTNGGSEYCGQVIGEATAGLGWSSSGNDYRAIFIAGNEEFTQGQVDYRSSCRTAIGRGIVVNTIFCGSRDEGVRTSWKDGADLADGRFMNIDQDRQVSAIPTPQDDEIARLGRTLNQTYVPFGADGDEGSARQEEQDMVAEQAAPAAATQRAMAKSRPVYDASGWDLVDAVKQERVEIDQLEAEELPAEMRDMNPEQRAAYLEQKSSERARIQQRIQELSEQRDAYLAEARRTQAATTAENTLDQALIEAIKSQAEAKGFSF